MTLSRREPLTVSTFPHWQIPRSKFLEEVSLFLGQWTYRYSLRYARILSMAVFSAVWTELRIENEIRLHGIRLMEWKLASLLQRNHYQLSFFASCCCLSDQLTSNLSILQVFCPINGVDSLS